MQWKRFMQMCTEITPVSDTYKLEVLQTVLDETSRIKLMGEWEKDPHLTFDRFWGQLEKTFSMDLEEKNWHELERISIAHMSRLTPSDFRNFQARFEVVANRLTELSPVEKMKRFLRALPQKYQEDIRREELRKAEIHWWLKIIKPCPLELVEVQRWTARVVGRPVLVEETPVAFLVDTENRAAHKLLLSCNEVQVRGQPLKIEPYKWKLTYSDAVEWLSKQLQTQQSIERTVYPYLMEPEAWIGVTEAQKTATAEKPETKTHFRPGPPEQIGASTPRFPTPPPRTQSPQRRGSEDRGSVPSPSSTRKSSPSREQGRGRGDGDSNQQPQESQGKGKSQWRDGRPSGKGKGKGKGNQGSWSSRGDSRAREYEGAESRSFGGGRRNASSQKKSGSSDGSICYGCENNGRPSNHDYKQCVFNKELSKLKWNTPIAPKRQGGEQGATSSNNTQ